MVNHGCIEISTACKTFVFFSLICLVILTCEPIENNKTENNSIDTNYKEADISIGLGKELFPYVKSFQKLSNSCTISEQFLFFSDPHLLGFNTALSLNEKNTFDKSFESMRALYEYLPIEFCLCGGDWLNNSDTQDSAKEKLIYADKKMKEWFAPYYKMMGNHDTNYQGIISQIDSSRGDLTYDFINNVYYSDVGKAYYAIKGKNTLFFILDSGIDWSPSIDNYRKEQIEWLASNLAVNEEAHVVIGMHMFYNGKVDSQSLLPMSREVLDLCSAFNRRSVYDYNNVKADFTVASGIVHFFISGHNHVDFVCDEYDIPCIGITRFITEGQPSFDLCLVDYNTGYLYTIRVGRGLDRHIPIVK